MKYNQAMELDPVELIPVDANECVIVFHDTGLALIFHILVIRKMEIVSDFVLNANHVPPALVRRIGERVDFVERFGLVVTRISK